MEVFIIAVVCVVAFVVAYSMWQHYEWAQDDKRRGRASERQASEFDRAVELRKAKDREDEQREDALKARRLVFMREIWPRYEAFELDRIWRLFLPVVARGFIRQTWARFLAERDLAFDPQPVSKAFPAFFAQVYAQTTVFRDAPQKYRDAAMWEALQSDDAALSAPKKYIAALFSQKMVPPLRSPLNHDEATKLCVTCDLYGEAKPFTESLRRKRDAINSAYPLAIDALLMNTGYRRTLVTDFKDPVVGHYFYYEYARLRSHERSRYRDETKWASFLNTMRMPTADDLMKVGLAAANEREIEYLLHELDYMVRNTNPPGYKTLMIKYPP